MSKDTRIPIRVSNKRAFIWDIDDLVKVRSQHHICGILGGTLPHLSQQNVFLGLPLFLMPEEVVLLVEKELAVLVDDPNAYPQPSVTEFQSWNVEQQSYIKKQLSANELNNTKDSEVDGRAMTEEAIRKRKERELKRQQKLLELQKQQSYVELGMGGESSVAPRPPPDDESSASKTTALYNVTVPAASSSLPWYSPNACTYNTIEAAIKAEVWSFPSNLHERAQVGVFRDLWEQGYFLGGGFKFGGDYLVYPGDPLRYHSHFTATVVEAQDQVIRPMEIVAHGRLGTATKKTHLFCGWNDKLQKVTYLSIEWAGFG